MRQVAAIVVTALASGALTGVLVLVQVPGAPSEIGAPGGPTLTE